LAFAEPVNCVTCCLTRRFSFRFDRAFPSVLAVEVPASGKAHASLNRSGGASGRPPSSIRHAMERKRAKEELGEFSTEIEVRRAQEQLKDAEILAYTDALTGLGNRRKAEAAIQEAIAATPPLSLLVFDMNGFKAINDRYGHNQGDQLLKVVAQRMRGAVRDTEVVCR
jgi:predicted signal transduction protein with EAL and GGDEF domain